MHGGIFTGSCLLFTLSMAAPHLPAQNAEIGKIRSIAESQHEIVIILIKKRDFGKAAEEANKMFQMKWPADQEPVLKDELLRFSDLFRHYGQPALAVQLLETNLSMFKSDKIKAEIWKDKGYLFKEMGQDDKALECFREAKRLEGKIPLRTAVVKK